MSDAKEHWGAFLNPDLVRTKLISAGLFLVAHEMLIDSIKGRPLTFFSDQWTEAGPIPSKKYEAEILDADPRGKRDPLRGSIAWWKKMEVISEEDERAIKLVTDARNEIAHEMRTLIGSASSPNYFEHFATLVAIIRKIETWWIINVEIETNPDHRGEQINEEGIIPGPIWVLQVLSQVALGEGEDAWEYHSKLFGDGDRPK